jgi:hypothetical protein
MDFSFFPLQQVDHCRGGHYHTLQTKYRQCNERAAHMTEPPASSVESELARLVRRHDRDRFLTVLFAPLPHRAALLALYAFNYEIARTREVVSA